jgi:hypothetical protein
MMSWGKFEEELEGLSRDEFGDALAKGLGRALSHVKTYGLDRVKDLVLYACLHDVSYDAQIEGSRAKWLFAMFVASPYYLELGFKPCPSTCSNSSRVETISG